MSWGEGGRWKSVSNELDARGGDVQNVGESLSLGGTDGDEGVGDAAQKSIEPFKGGLSGRGI